MTERSAGIDDRSDISGNDWAARHVPGVLLPCLRLARLDRPIGTWLLLFPGWWAIALAASGWPDWRLIVLFGIGAVVMRGAGCTFNDIVDREFDGRVARTRTRPIPSGAISVRGAVVFLLVQLAIGAAILLSLDVTAIELGVFVLLLVVTYPFMKRVTYWPQLFLGLNFNWGALMGWAAVRGGVALPALLLYVGGIFWTLGYDTIYAHQDKEDDALIGVKSSALALGAATSKALVVFYAAALALWVAASTAAGLAWPIWPALLLVAGHFAWQVARVDIDDPADCLTKFRANRGVGWIFLIGIVAARVIGG
ncbi:MAG: 4-hydroxybenzoate octaprenyltransferase [Alphaproteobacteria bacterium]|nr:4-hydroxybenzoate octaprenyltransferase [Alphaproteobacteria bacterium]